VKENKPDLVACEGDLSAGQQRHLEDRLKTRVVDRAGIILDIFALHAQSAEGKLQVELAQLEYSYSRQEGLWQHLERLGGGVGTRGPGESQLESDRRMIRNRMGVLRKRLGEVERSRETMREEDPDDKRGLHEVDRTEHAVMIASMGCSPVEETDRLTEMAELLHTAGMWPTPARTTRGALPGRPPSRRCSTRSAPMRCRDCSC